MNKRHQQQDFLPDMPSQLRALLVGSACRQEQIGRSAAKVYRLIKGEETLYLKIEPDCDEIQHEYRVLSWLNGKLPVPEVLAWIEQDGLCYLLTRAVTGAMACDFQEDRGAETCEETVRLLAEGLRLLQSINIHDCPFDRTLEKKLGSALHNIEHERVDLDEQARSRFATPMGLYEWLIAHKPPEELCFTHGDYCLPNIFLADGRVTGFIDLGRSGVADKWQDIALCYRSLRHNVPQADQEQAVNQLFAHLQLEPDWMKIEYYILLDELF